MNFFNPELYRPPHEKCPLCGDTGFGPLHVIARYTHPFKVDRCQKCGFIFMNPLFTEKTFLGFYNEGYYGGTAAYSYHDERDEKKYPPAVRIKRIQKIASYVKGGNFLDVGAAFGQLMQSASKYFTPYGIEISPYAGTIARQEFGERLHVGTLEDHPFKPGHFSAITMIEVLEHISNPVTALTECHRLLETGGVLVLQTANMEGLQAKIYGHEYSYYMPGHCSYFSRRSLEFILRNIGFRRILVFYPVEFGLLPKLKKSRGRYKSWWEYRKWLRIILYHLASKIHCGNCAMTSSMVMYAFK